MEKKKKFPAKMYLFLSQSSLTRAHGPGKNRKKRARAEREEIIEETQRERVIENLLQTSFLLLLLLLVCEFCFCCVVNFL